MKREFTPQETHILNQLAKGLWIRMLDGRCGDGFVDMDALHVLVTDGMVEKFDNQGVPFVRAISKIPRPEIVKDEHLEYLDDLRDSGETNMFGGAPYLGNNFGLSKKDARTILLYWIESFGERHPVEK